MISITSLWLPILLSAVFVFIASSIIHMLFTYHYKDFKKVPEEDKLMDAVRNLKIPPGEYLVPHAGSPKGMKSPEFQEKMNKGPGLIMTVWPGGRPAMGTSLVQWFIYSIIVGIIVAYVSGRSLLGTGAEYMLVFRITGVVAFACYTVAHWQDSIWFKRSWGRTFRGIVDGAIYALLTAGTFGWLWPR
jgi:Flp pilus assembly protein TadB